MSKIKLIFIWIFGIFIGLPVFFVLYALQFIYVFDPLKHELDVWRMDNRNGKVWETADAKLVSLETQMTIFGEARTVSSEIVCYQGYVAIPSTFKDLGATTGLWSRSVGKHGIEQKVSDDVVLFAGLRNLCWRVLKSDPIDEYPDIFREGIVVLPAHGAYCRQVTYDAEEPFLYQTQTVEIRRPQITSVKTVKLRDVTTREALGSSRRICRSDLFCRFGYGLERMFWDSSRRCWSNPGCRPEITRICGDPNLYVLPPTP